MSQNIIDQIGAEVQMVSVNGKKSSDFVELGTISLLVPQKAFDHIQLFGKDADIKPIVHAKLLEELRQYVAPALMHLPGFWDDASEKVKESVIRKNLASQFFFTVEFDFRISRMESINSFDLLQAHVQANDKYEDTLLAHTVKILKMHRKNVHQAAENSLENRAKLTAIKSAEPTEPSDKCIRVVKVKNPKLQRSFILELRDSVYPDKSTVEIADHTLQLMHRLLNEYCDTKNSIWMRSVSSGSMSHEMRLTYLQQIKDVNTMIEILNSEETVVELVYVFVIPWLNREISNQEYTSFFTMMNTLLHRKNWFSLENLFSDYQGSVGTRHKDGVVS